MKKVAIILTIALGVTPVAKAFGVETTAACDPETKAALTTAAEQAVNGVEARLWDDRTGFKKATSAFDLGCLDDLIKYDKSSILFNPDDVLSTLFDLIEKSICTAAAQAYNDAVGDTFRGDLFDIEGLEDIPGITISQTTETVPITPIISNAAETSNFDFLKMFE